VNETGRAQRSAEGWPRRLRGLVRKEFIQIARDPSSLAIAFFMPVVLLFLFGYGVSLDAENVPVAVVAEQRDADSAEFTAALRGSTYFRVREMDRLAEATRALLQGEVNAIVRLRANFAAGVQGPVAAPVQIIVNGVDANTARLVAGYVEGAWSTWVRQRAEAAGRDFGVPVELEHRVWFNAELRSRNFLVPWLVVVIMTLIGALLTALVMAREWERGTMEAMMVTPVGVTEVLLGKLIPYFVLGTGGLLLSVAMALFLFDVPLRGSFWALIATASLFLLVALGMGLLISSVAKNQFVAGQVAIIATFLPAFLLSGFIFDIDSMPRVVQAITHVIAARYFVAIVDTLFLAGNVWEVIVPNALALAVMAVAFLGLTWRITRKRLE
jgi:ABC-2 type transport system permease protein